VERTRPDRLSLTPSRLSPASATGSTVTDIVSVINGTASGDGSADGGTLTTDGSLIGGVASGSANADGTTSVVTVSLLAGTATAGDVDGSATGDTVSYSYTLIPGEASVTTTEVRFGDGRSEGRYIRPVVNARINPRLLYTKVSLLPGVASGERNITVDGSIIVFEAVLLPGKASGNSEARGAIIDPTSVTLVPGAASGFDAQAEEDELMLLLSMED
jgi:hypothetical protein